MLKKIFIGILSAALIIAGITSLTFSNYLDGKFKYVQEFTFNSPEPTEAKLAYVIAAALILAGLFGFDFLFKKKENS